MSYLAESYEKALLENHALRAQRDSLLAALAEYQDQYCEGFCKDFPPGWGGPADSWDCGGCLARVTIAATKAQE